MRHEFENKFLEQLENFPLEVQRKFQKQLRFLLQDVRHPSLHAKKYGGTNNIWQARVDKNVRFYFEIKSDKITFLAIKKHPK